MIVNELITALNFKIDVAAIRKYDAALLKMGRDAKKATEGMRANFGKVGAAFRVTALMMQDVWSRKLSHMAASVSKFTSQTVSKMQAMASKSRASMHGIQSSATQLRGLMAGGLAMVGIGATAGNFSESIKQYESYRAALKTSTGDMDKAGKKYIELEAFANKYGQRTDSIAKSFLRLNNLDLDASSKALLAYGNIAAGTPGKGVIDFVEAVADAVTGENERLKEFGIKAKTEGDKVTYTLGNMKKTVHRDGKSIEKGLQDMINMKFGTAMADQANTPAAAMARLSNRTDRMFRNIWNAGINKEGDSLFKTLDRLMVTLETEAPKAIMATVKAIKSMKPALQMLKDFMPIIAFGVGIVVARMVGLKVITAGVWIWRAAIAFRAMSLAAMAANVAAFAIPIAIGAVVAAVVWLGYEIYKFSTTGKGMIADLAKEFPEFGVLVKELGDLFNEWKPKILEIIETLRIMAIDGIVWMSTKGMDILRYWLIPAVIATWETFKTLWTWGKWVFDNIVGALGDMSQGFTDWKTNVQIMVDAVMEKLKPLIGAFNAVKDAAGSIWDKVTGGSGGTDPGGLGTFNSMAAKLAKAGYNVYSGYKKCFQGYSEIYKATFGDYGNLKGGSAYMAADQLARDTRMVELQLTPAQIQKMLADPEMRKKLNGLSAVYDRQSGFSPIHGHIEAWDTINMKALYGNGASSLVRSDQNLAHGRFFLPADKAASIPNIAQGGGMSARPSATVEINQIFSGPANPAQVQAATKKGVDDSFTRQGLSRSSAASPKH